MPFLVGSKLFLLPLSLVSVTSCIVHLFNPIFDISDQFLETLKDIQSRLNFYSLCCNIRLRSFFCPADPVVSCFRFCGRIRRFTEINIVVQASALLHKTYPLVIKKFLFGDNWSYYVFYLAMTRQ